MFRVMAIGKVGSARRGTVKIKVLLLTAGCIRETKETKKYAVAQWLGR